MRLSIRERVPVFELSLVLVAISILWAELRLHDLKLQADRDRGNTTNKFGLLEKAATNWHQESQRLQVKNEQMQQVFGELRSEFTNELKELEKNQTDQLFKLNDAFKIQEEYSRIAEHVESGISAVQAALTNYVNRQTPAESTAFERKRGEFKNWIAKQKERNETERFPAKSQELKEWVRAEQPPGTNSALAITRDLGALVEELTRAWTTYVAQASRVIGGVGQPFTDKPALARMTNTRLDAEQLFELARQARADGLTVKSFLEPQVQLQAQQKARRQQLAIQSFLTAQARLETNQALSLDKLTNDLAVASLGTQPASSDYSSALYPLIAAQIGLGIFLVVSVYRKVVERLRLRLYQSDTEGKLAHFEKLAVWQAHELKQPLTAITAWLWTLQQSLSEGTPEHSVATAIRKETDRLDQIVKNFLSLARPLEPKLVPVKAEPALREIQKLFGPQLDQQCIKLKLEPPGDVGFRADPQQLKQVLINLVQNAADSIEHDGSITLRTRRDKVPLKGRTSDVVIIEVEDDGPGIPTDVQDRLFEPFFSTKKEGTGLGLPIAARIIDKHGGALEFKSTPGKGTTFDVVLPMYRDGG